MSALIATSEIGCAACRQVGPLLTAPGTSGRTWHCGCGTAWLGQPDVYREHDLVLVRFPLPHSAEGRDEWPWLPGVIETVCEGEWSAGEYRVLVDVDALAESDDEGEFVFPLCYRTADEIRPRPRVAVPIRSTSAARTDNPRPGEICSCGRTAIIVFLTEKYGRVGYCGAPNRLPLDPCRDPECPRRASRHDHLWCSTQ